MAYVDYLHCAVCDTKAIYDADLNYEVATGEYGRLYDIAAICKDCSKTHSIEITDMPSNKRISDFLDD